MQAEENMLTIPSVIEAVNFEGAYLTLNANTQAGTNVAIQLGSHQHSEAFVKGAQLALSYKVENAMIFRDMNCV